VQEEVITAINRGYSLMLAVMPTGGGNVLQLQLPLSKITKNSNTSATTLKAW